MWELILILFIVLILVGFYLNIEGYDEYVIMNNQKDYPLTSYDRYQFAYQKDKKKKLDYYAFNGNYPSDMYYWYADDYNPEYYFSKYPVQVSRSILEADNVYGLKDYVDINLKTVSFEEEMER
jgi:hypothetical protein